jgi:hypothetical protein
LLGVEKSPPGHRDKKEGKLASTTTTTMTTTMTTVVVVTMVAVVASPLSRGRGTGPSLTGRS